MAQTTSATSVDVFYEKDERENRCIGKVWSGIEEKMPEISRAVN